MDQHILIVEDDADIRDALFEILVDEGYPVAAAANGSEGLDVLRTLDKVGLVLLDLMMPVMNGWEFAVAMRAQPAWTRIPIVVISADGHITEKSEGLRADGYLKKPVELDGLLETVARFVGR